MTDTPAERGPENPWERLRRRKVVQWGLVYVAAAWGFLQGLEYVGESFNWPQQVRQIALLALVIGLPIVLVLAWYHGDRGEQRIRGTELAIISLLFLAGGGIFWYYQRASDTASASAPPPPSAAAFATDASIAVLPFVNMSTDKDQEFFADGISEELLNLLAQVPELRVIARTSSFSFKGKDVEIAEIARRLNVANVLEGSVRKSGDALRITAQLVRASDSSHLWSQTYDRRMTDVFALQDEIATAVADELKIKLLGAAPKVRTTDLQAYAFFLQAREIAKQFTPAALEQAIALYKQALAIDSTYAPAWDGLAAAYVDQMDISGLLVDQGLPLARDAIQQALAADPSYAPAHARAALIEGAIEGDLAAAAQHLEQGLALDSSNLDLIEVAIRIARRLGRSQQTVDLAEYVIARDPINVIGYWQAAISYSFAGRLDAAAAAWQTCIKLRPGLTGQHLGLGEVLMRKGDAKAALAEFQQEPSESFRLMGLSTAYHALGRTSESDAALDELIRKHEYTMASGIAYVLAYRGENDRAFEWLNKAAKYRDINLGTVPFEPMLESLHSDPRWLPFLRKHGRTPEQLAAIKFEVRVPK